MESPDANIIYIKLSYIDLDPDKRSWYYDALGVKRDKTTNKLVVFVSEDHGKNNK